MITEDTERLKQLGREVVVNHVITGALPQDKGEHVQRMQKQGEFVSIAGDGRRCEHECKKTLHFFYKTRLKFKKVVGTIETRKGLHGLLTIPSRQNFE